MTYTFSRIDVVDETYLTGVSGGDWLIDGELINKDLARIGGEMVKIDGDFIGSNGDLTNNAWKMKK